MRIQSITINNYRSFSNRNNVLKVNPEVTTIIGMNGSGKTNIIDAIGLIDLVNGSNTLNWPQKRNRFHDESISISVKLSPLESEDRSIFGNNITEICFGEKDNYSLSGGVADAFQTKLDKFDIVIAALKEGKYSDQKEKSEVIDRAKKVKDFKKQTLKRTSNYIDILIRDINDHCGNNERLEEILEYAKCLQTTCQVIIKAMPIIFKHDDAKTLKDSYIIDELKPGSGRSNEASLDKKPNDLFCSLLKLAQIQRESIVSAMEKRQSATNSMMESVSADLLERNVMTKFRRFYKNDSEKIRLKFRIEGHILHLTFFTEFAATEFSERSNGLRWYFNMFIDLMNRVDNERPIVYILDEPGIHLHINAQDELKHLLFEQAAQGSQIIYTTHSPYMIDQNLGNLRGITKSKDNTFSWIHNSLYDSELAGEHTLDTLSPVAAAMGMDLKLTPGLSPHKLNVIVEGVTDQIYLNTMAKALGVDMENISIIPSTGAQNIKHLCSILMGWGFKFLAIYDYDREGINCAKELNKKLNLEYGKSFILLKDICDDEFNNKSGIDSSECIVIESLISEADRNEYKINVEGGQSQKKIMAVQFYSAVQSGRPLSDETRNNFCNCSVQHKELTN